MSHNNHKATTLPAAHKLYIWNGELLFLSNAPMPNRAHRVVQEKLLICLEGTLSLYPCSSRGNESMVITGSCLLRTGVLLDKARIDGRNAVLAIVYLAPFSQDYPALESLMEKASEGIYYNHPQEQALAQQLRSLRDGPARSPKEVQRQLRDLMIPTQVSRFVFREFDQRILDIVQRIRGSLRENLSLGELAAAVNLSGSRLEKLFKQQTGLPITQYRLRYRVFYSAVLMAQGRTVTDAAQEAGFSSSAHFSRAFRAINGLAPSTPFLKPPFLQTFIDEDVMQTLASTTNRQFTI
ncbi:MAG: AraC family transcriptional regulator [Halomonadaceae bacterium]|nr:MAG: AraC family transcriptional regulator [Halomonadaceae bacterium]